MENFFYSLDSIQIEYNLEADSVSRALNHEPLIPLICLSVSDLFTLHTYLNTRISNNHSTVCFASFILTVYYWVEPIASENYAFLLTYERIRDTIIVVVECIGCVGLKEKATSTFTKSKDLLRVQNIE